MRLATTSECREIDLRSQSEWKIKGDILMESAGRLSAKYILDRYPEVKAASESVVIVCGPGGNGGDGLVVARHLKSFGADVRVVLLESSSAHELYSANLKRLDGTGARVTEFDENAKREISRAALIVDAVFGIGLKGIPSGIYLKAIEAVNSASAKKISLDVPSGLDADRGVPMGEAVKADVTLTFGIAKAGFALNEGPRHVGDLEVIDIGFPLALVKEVARTVMGFDRSTAKKLLPKRSVSSNKSTHGRAMIFAGSAGMGGAAVLCGTAAARVGAGYVVVATSGKPQEILNSAPEFMTANLSDETLLASAKWTAAAIGPGLGSKTSETLKKLSEFSKAPTVIDADALTALAKDAAHFRGKLAANWILTPHAGELSRLIGIDSKLIEADRLRYAREASLLFGCLVLLKGFRTVVSNGTKSVVVLSGNAALAKAGSGDVLTGIITGFLCQGLDPFQAACLGAYVHGRIADEWLLNHRDILALQPSDLLSTLPILLKTLRRKN